jgi:hypothetical protein
MTDFKVHYLEENEAQFRALAKARLVAGHEIARKLIEVADEIAAKAAKLRAEGTAASRRSRN